MDSATSTTRTNNGGRTFRRALFASPGYRPSVRSAASLATPRQSAGGRQLFPIHNTPARGLRGRSFFAPWPPTRPHVKGFPSASSYPSTR